MQKKEKHKKFILNLIKKNFTWRKQNQFLFIRYVFLFFLFPRNLKFFISDFLFEFQICLLKIFLFIPVYFLFFISCWNFVFILVIGFPYSVRIWLATSCPRRCLPCSRVLYRFQVAEVEEGLPTEDRDVTHVQSGRFPQLGTTIHGEKSSRNLELSTWQWGPIIFRVVGLR